MLRLLTVFDNHRFQITSGPFHSLTLGGPQLIDHGLPVVHSEPLAIGISIAMLPTITIAALSMYVTLIPTSASMLTWNEMPRLQLGNVSTGITDSDSAIITVPPSYPGRK